MDYFPIALVAIVPTVIAFGFFLSRPHLGVWGKVIVFAIWFVSSIPLGAVIYALSGLFYLSSVGYGAWDAKPREAEMAVTAPLALLLNGYLALIAWWFDLRRSRRSAKAPP